MLSSSSFTVPAISPSYKPLSHTRFFSELQTPKKNSTKTLPKKFRTFLSIDFCKLKKTSKSLLQTFKELFLGLRQGVLCERKIPTSERRDPPQRTLNFHTHTHTHTQFATSKQKFLFTKNQTKLVIQSKHACPLAQKHTPNPKRLLSTQSKRQEVPPRDELPPDPKDELFLSASWSTTDAQHKNPFKGSLKQTCKSLNFVATLGKRKTFSNKPFFSQIARPTKPSHDNHKIRFPPSIFW
jgi:hypothetical protein